MVAVGPHGCLPCLVHMFRVIPSVRFREFFHKLDYVWLWIFSLFCYMLDDLPVVSLTMLPKQFLASCHMFLEPGLVGFFLLYL